MNESPLFPEDRILYHDFDLRGYEVRDYGRTIVLDLFYKWEPVSYSRLKFQDVESYRFTHTGGAIITDIFEVPFMEALRDLHLDFRGRLDQIGGLEVNFHTNEEYGNYFTSQGLKTWLILSAIGFEGMVVARSLISIDPGNGDPGGKAC